MASQPRRNSPGILCLLALAFLVGVNGWLRSGCLVPYLTATEPEYLLLLPSPVMLARWFLGAFTLLAGLHALCARYVFAMTTVEAALEWRSVRYLTPLGLLLLPPAAVAMLATPVRRYAGPWLYVSIDLFWWLLLVIAALLVVEIDRSGPRYLERLSSLLEAASASSRSRWWFDIALAVVLTAGSLLASPPLRFQSVLVGDEPKYLRYLENWYRGGGMDVTGLGPIAELPADSSSNVTGNVRLFGGSLSRLGPDLAADGRRLIGLSAPARPGPATSQGGWFVDGKRGGVYQVHSPGISFLLFPGYVIDRALSRTHIWHPQFPSDLYCTNAIVLILYLLWGGSVFRLVWSYTNRAVLAWGITCVLFLCLPVTAFAYQYYPEVAAGLLIALLARYTLMSTDAQRNPAIGYGLLAGCLPWLHVRFLPLTLAAAVAVVLRRPRDLTAIAGFIGGVAVPVLMLSLYDYHVTGSLLPWSLYALIPDEPLFSVARAWRDLPSFWFDRTWGLVAHSPIYLLALPGVWLAWRHNRVTTFGVVAAVLAMAIPAAAHGYTAAFTTPLRLVTAVIPLLALPLADATVAFGSSRVFGVAFAGLGLISIQNGLTYNAHLIKSEASLHASTVGGWLFPLLLPDFEAPGRLAQPMTLVWLAVTVGLLVAPIVVARARNRTRSVRAFWFSTAVVATTMLLFAVTSSVVAGVTGLRMRPDFIMKPGDARDRLIHFELTGEPAVRWSSENGSIQLSDYFPNPEGTETILTVRPDPSGSHGTVEMAIDVRRPGNRRGWGTALVDFGDESTPMTVTIEGEARVSHQYARPDTYHVRADLELWGLPARSITESVQVAGW